MSGVQDSLEIKFRLIDGSDIGPTSFPAAASVASLKENILSQWPKGSYSPPCVLLFGNFVQFLLCF